MMEDKKRSLGLLILAAVLILTELYYWYPVYTGTYEYMNSLFVFSGWAIWVWSQVILEFILVFSVTYGFYKRKNWARIYTIGYQCYTAFWAVVSMFIWHHDVLEHYIFFAISVVVVMYLMMSGVKKYFGVKIADDLPSSTKPSFYRHGDCTLYKREVKLKNGGTRIFYYFSKEPSNKGKPCNKPDDYEVGINKRSGIPFLKKKK